MEVGAEDRQLQVLKLVVEEVVVGCCSLILQGASTTSICFVPFKCLPEVEEGV